MGRNIFEIIVEVVFWIFFVALVYQLVLKITGHSPTDFTILYTGFGIIGAYVLSASYKMGVFFGRVEEFMKNSKDSFKNMKEDFKRLESRLLR